MNRKFRYLLVGMLLLTVISTVSYCASPYNTEQAKIIEVNKSITGSGFILRKETPVYSDISGVFEPLVKDGVRVARQSEIGTVISGNLDKKLAKELEDVNARIESIRATDSFSSLYASDDARIYSAIREVTQNIRENVYADNFTAAANYKNQLATLISRKAQGGDAGDDLLVSLEDEKYRIEQQLGGSRKQIFAPASGIFYLNLDGLEFSGDESILLDYTCKDINSFSEKLNSYVPEPRFCAKISDTFAWYLAATLPSADCATLSTGDEISISIDESSFVSATVLSVKKGKQESAVIIKCTKNVDGITDKRTAEFEIRQSHCSGIFVPAAAVRVVNNTTGVYTINSNKIAAFRAINIIYEDNDFYLVQNKYIPPVGCKYKALRVYEDILVNPEVVKGLDTDTKKSQ